MGALAASFIIAGNGLRLIRPTLRDLMDRMPDGPIVEQIRRRPGVDGVRATEKIRVRKLGAQFFVDLHVQADPMLPLFEAHILSGKVKGAITTAMPNVAGVLIHMEPFDGVAGGE